MERSLDTYLREELRRRAFARLEAGVRAGSDLMCEILKATVSGRSSEDVRGPVAITPYLRADRKSGRVAGYRNKTGGGYRRGGAPGKQSGDGERSICFDIRERDEAAGTITVRIGVDDSAPGGTWLQSYMLAHDMGIKYPTRPGKDPDRIRPGTVIQHPWLRVGINHYWPEFAAEIVMVARGLA